MNLQVLTIRSRQLFRLLFLGKFCRPTHGTTHVLIEEGIPFYPANTVYIPLRSTMIVFRITGGISLSMNNTYCPWVTLDKTIIYGVHTP